MTRVSVSTLGGVGLALLLFWLLALLVSPPEEAFEEIEEPMALSSVEMPEILPETPEPPAEAAPVPPPPVAPPPPLPEPAPLMESPIALPEPELPPETVEPLELDTELPELTEAVPEPPPPRPQPQPRPAPAPQPTPAPTTQPAPAPQPSPQPAPVPQPAPRTPVDVGQIAPTSRVPPAYPARAQRRGLEGFVELEFVIRADGSVDPSSIRVTSARPRNVFDDAARQAVARWRFQPAEGLRRARQRLEFQLR